MFAFFCQKSKLFELKIFTGVLFCDTEAPGKLGAKTECCFPNKHPKNLSICSKRAKRIQISDFVSFFCLKSKLPEQNDLHRSFTLWHWKTMQSLGQNCILLSRSAQKRFDQFISSERKVSKFLSFISLFYVKDKLLESKSLTGVSFCDREEPCKVWVKTESCFRDQPPPIPKEIGEFLSSRQEGSKFQIILFLCFL